MTLLTAGCAADTGSSDDGDGTADTSASEVTFYAVGSGKVCWDDNGSVSGGASR